MLAVASVPWPIVPASAGSSPAFAKRRLGCVQSGSASRRWTTMQDFFDSLISNFPAAAWLGHRAGRAKPVAAERVPVEQVLAAELEEPKTSQNAPAENAPEVSREDLWRQCESLANTGRILDRFVEDLRL